MRKLLLLYSALSVSLLLYSCEDLLENERDNDENDTCDTSYADAGSSLHLDGTCDLLSHIWGPGSNDIEIGGGLNYSTEPGIGWSQQYDGIFVTAYSITGEDSEYITNSMARTIRVEGPENAIIEVWDLETMEVVNSNIDHPGSPVLFEATANHRYGGFAWYADNAQKDIAIYAAYH